MIFLTGAPRSGTIVTMGILEACGADLGEASASGLKELKPFRDGVVKGLLKRNGADPLGQGPLLSPDSIKPSPAIKSALIETVGSVDAVKALKAVMFWPVIADAFPNAKWIILKRDPQKVAESCLRAPFMKRYSTLEEWIEYAQHYHNCCDQLEASDNQTMTLNPSDYLTDGDFSGLQDAIEWAGLEWNEKKARGLIKKTEWHG